MNKTRTTEPSDGIVSLNVSTWAGARNVTVVEIVRDCRSFGRFEAETQAEALEQAALAIYANEWTLSETSQRWFA